METFTGLAFQSVLSFVISHFLPPYQSTVVPTSLSELTAGFNLAFPIRQFHQRLHDIGLEPRLPASVLYTRQNPHMPVT